MKSHHLAFGVFVSSFFLIAIPGRAAPNIANVSQRGLRIGDTTTIILDGADLLPAPSLVANFPIAAQAIKPSSTPQRVEIEVQVAADAQPGIYSVRLASGKGISNAVLIGVDRLPQLAFAPEVAALPIALHGNLAGTQILHTKFRGTKGQRIVADVEARRLGAGWQPVVRIQDSRGRQLAWSPARQALAGDPRAELVLPADGEYQVELHDLLFRAGGPSYFRLKIGELAYADLAYPLGVQAGQKQSLTFTHSNLPADASIEVAGPDRLVPQFLSATVPSNVLWTGARPTLAVSSHPEVAEAAPTGAPAARQQLPPVPVAVSGRLAQANEEDQFLVPVKPGTKIRIAVFAQRLGSPLDGLLSVRNEAGAQLAANDDRPGDPDPGIELQVPENTTQIVVALKDLLKRGGTDYVYRIEMTDAAAPDFDVTAETDQINLPAESTQAYLVRINRRNYGGPIQLAAHGLPESVSLSGSEIPAGANVGLLTFTVPGGKPLAGIARITATSSPETNLSRLVSIPDSPDVKRFPAGLGDFGFAVSEPSPLRVAWTGSLDTPWFLGDTIPLHIVLSRSAGVAGSVRLRLLSTQPMPRKTVKENNQDKEVDDVDRAIRLAGEVVAPADANHAIVGLMVPGDLPLQDWGVVLAADLLAADNKTVLATSTTTLLMRRPVAPFAVELAANPGLEAKAGNGDTGKLTGKIRRHPGFHKAVELSLAGLPQDYASPRLTVGDGQVDFEFPIRFAAGAKPVELKDLQLVAESAAYRPTSPAGPIKVVPGTP